MLHNNQIYITLWLYWVICGEEWDFLRICFIYICKYTINLIAVSIHDEHFDVNYSWKSNFVRHLIDCYIGKSITQMDSNIYVHNAYKFSMFSKFEIGYPRTTCHLRSKFIESYFRKSGSHTRIEWRQISIIFALKGHVSLRRNSCQMEWYLYHRSRQVMI